LPAEEQGAEQDLPTKQSKVMTYTEQISLTYLARYQVFIFLWVN